MSSSLVPHLKEVVDSSHSDKKGMDKCTRKTFWKLKRHTFLRYKKS